MCKATRRPVLAHPGIDELLALHRADALASGRGIEHVEFCEQCLRAWPPEELNPPPLVTGDDLKALGIPQGPVYKRLLQAVREAQLDGVVTTTQAGLALVKQLRVSGDGLSEPEAEATDIWGRRFRFRLRR